MGECEEIGGLFIDCNLPPEGKQNPFTIEGLS